MARKKQKLELDSIEPNGHTIQGPHEDEPAFVTAEDFDLIMSNLPPDPLPPSNNDPSPTPSREPSTEALEERMRRLEDAITRLSTHVQREPTPSPSGQSMLGAAQALVEAGRHLLPPVRLDSTPRSTTASRWWLLTDTFAELQAIYFMYVDPRYRLSWVGRIVPPVLLVLFLTSDLWMKYAFCGIGALPFVHLPIELCLCYLLFKFVTMEARYYRQTAPDLPPSLRL